MGTLSTGSARPLRVHLVVDLLDLAGAERQTLLLCGALAEAGHEVQCSVLWTGKKNTNALVATAQKAGALIHTPIFAGHVQRPKDIIGAVRTVRKRLHQQKADVVQSVLVASDLVATLATTSSRSAVHVLSRLNLTEHFHDSWPRSSVRRFTVRRCDGLVANSHAVLSDAIENEGANPSTSTVIHNILPPEAFEKVAAASDSSHLPTLITVANIRADKGHDTALEAAELLKQRELAFEWIFVGGGDRSDYVAREVARRNLPVKLVGSVEDPRRFLSCADLYVQASQSEGMANATLEAMAIGLPVIATDVGGTSEALASSGVLVPPNHPRELADAIELALKAHDQRQRMASSALLRAEHFRAEASAEAHTTFFRSLLG